MRRALLFLEALPHLLEVRARTPALAVAHPIDGLEVMKKKIGAHGFARHGARLHVGDAFPGFGGAREIIFHGAFGLDERSVAAVGAQARVHCSIRLDSESQRTNTRSASEARSNSRMPRRPSAITQSFFSGGDAPQI